jgi:hypothetical protein
MACAGSRATAWTVLSCQLIVSKSASVQTVLAPGRSGAHTAARGSARPANRPVPAVVPARAKANRCGPLVSRHRTQAERTSLRPIARPTVREPGQVVVRAPSRMVKTADPICSVVFAVAKIRGA